MTDDINKIDIIKNMENNEIGTFNHRINSLKKYINELQCNILKNTK